MAGSGGDWAMAGPGKRVRVGQTGDLFGGGETRETGERPERREEEEGGRETCSEKGASTYGPSTVFRGFDATREEKEERRS